MPARSIASRRRLTIAALLLLVLGGGLWWTVHPRVDLRLVGTWVNDVLPDVGVTRHFERDGFATFESPSTGTRPNRDVLRWQCEGSMLVMRFSSGNGLTARFLDALYDTIERVFKRRSSMAHRYRIVEITPTTLRLQAIDPAGKNLGPIGSYHRVAD